MTKRKNTPVSAVDPGPVELHARNVEFDWADTPLHWLPGHPYPAHTVTALNLLLPEGERWFVRTFNETLPLVADEQLAAAMRGFIGQEAIHAESHDKVLWTYLIDHGIDARPFQRQMEWVFRKLLAPHEKSSPKAARKHLIERLWLIAAIEHYTAELGDFALNSSWSEIGGDPQMVDLFCWHGAEEVEHRAVAYDVANYFGNSYLTRARTMLLALPALIWLVFRGAKDITRQDPATRRMSYLGRRVGYWRGVQANVVPSMLGLAWSTVKYFRPGFHPDQVGSTAQAVAYLASSPAARRAG
ncbi:metal-dependent hydrolase [Gordonia sp. X0973]|uniref:metal-dependent hydrolase n=1 Tax=Gordonia sp. X0973 TaxID=2742602 RepID=UPI000F52551E|nr:metal-dependent hydrolase [Gordonia sp. X0973]QKT08613.1 metal-dependent hydrolase [Gordonia sp. X0973]